MVRPGDIFGNLWDKVKEFTDKFFNIYGNIKEVKDSFGNILWSKTSEVPDNPDNPETPDVPITDGKFQGVWKFNSTMDFSKFSVDIWDDNDTGPTRLQAPMSYALQSNPNLKFDAFWIMHYHGLLTGAALGGFSISYHGVEGKTAYTESHGWLNEDYRTVIVYSTNEEAGDKVVEFFKDNAIKIAQLP